MKSQKNLPTNILTRQWRLTRLALDAGVQAAGRSLTAALGGKKQSLWDEEFLLSQASKWTEELGQLKGSVMKAGQLLSVYGEHFFPPRVNAVLKKLQSQSPPLDWPAIRRAVEKEWDRSLLARVDIDPEPIGSASIGQVHRARVRGRTEWVALKIQYPGVEQAIASDLKALKTFFTLLQLLPKTEDTDLIFAEVQAMLEQETDYRKEREFAEIYRARLQDQTEYLIPKIHGELCTRRILAMDLVEALPLDGPEVQNLAIERRSHLAKLYLNLYFKEIFDWGMVQTDPHIGNYRVALGATAREDRLVLFDFGAVRDVEDSFLQPYRQMISNLVLGRIPQFFAAAKDLGFLRTDDPESLRDIYQEVCALIVEPFAPPEQLLGQPYFDPTTGYDWRASQLPKRVAEKGRDLLRGFALRTPPHQTLFLDRKLGGSFIFCSVLGAQLHGRPLIMPYLQR